MAHINKLIDFTVVVYLVLNNEVLLVNHLKLKKWLPLGGHIELDEDPEEAAIREAREESGFDIEIVAEKPNIEDPSNERSSSPLENKLLFRPEYLDIHKVGGNHRHVGIVYFARVKSGILKRAESEHSEIGWFSLGDLDSGKLNLGPAIKFYAKKALEKLGS